LFYEENGVLNLKSDRLLGHHLYSVSLRVIANELGVDAHQGNLLCINSTEFATYIPSPVAQDVYWSFSQAISRSEEQGRAGKWAQNVFSCSVIYVPGNHEYFREHIDNTLENGCSVV
ncbi:MAG: hypothetical protein WCS87_18975, partial [Methylococcaceae bacterium]